jgi:AcrR family transcriptional regulator
MMTFMSAGRRGVARSETARTAILEATAAVISRVGYDRATVEGIAAEAGVGKQTIYRWWPSKSAVVVDSLMEGMMLPQTFVPPDTGDIEADLRTWLGAMAGFFQDPANASLLRSLVTATVDNEQVGARLNERLGSPGEIAARLHSAEAAGQLRPGLPVRLLSEAFIGVVVARLLARSTLTADDVRDLTALVMHGAGPS